MFNARNSQRTRIRGTRRRRSPNRIVENLEKRMLLAGDLVAHWVADSINDQVSNGEPVASWMDSVGNISADGRGAPQLVESAFSGHSVVRFDASDGEDWFIVDPSVSPMAGANDFTLVVAFATSDTNQVGDANGDWFDGTGLVDGSRLGITDDWGVSLTREGRIGTGMGDGFGQPITNVYSTESGLNDGQLHVAVISRSSGNLSVYVDGGAATHTNGGSTDPRVSAPMTFGILQNGKNPYVGDIAEIRVYDGPMSESEATNIYQQLNTFYNNSQPTANDDVYQFQEDPAFGFHVINASSGVLGNDTDPESDSLSAVIVDGPSSGTVRLNADGGFVYDPVDDFFGTDSFTYTANDSQTSNVATVTLNVENVYDPAVAVADTYKAVPTQTLSVSAGSGVLANDENPDQAVLQAMLVQDTANGTVTLAADGSFEYDPQGFAGITTFSYRVNDGTNLSNTIEATLIVNTPPAASDDQFDVTEDIELARDATTGVLANDTDADGNSMTVTLVDGPQNGLLILNADGSFTYTPDENYFGPDQFTYELSDGEDNSNLATVQLNVNAVDDSPVASDDGYFAKLGDQFDISAAGGLLANDTDVDSTNLTVSAVTQPANGTLQLNADGSFLYTPNAGFQGIDSFTYQAGDGNSVSSTATATLFVGSPPVQITEIMAANATSLNTRVRQSEADAFTGEQLTPDWIELKNLTSATLNISGYHLTDSDNDLKKWAFPEGTMLAPNEYYLVAVDRLNILNPALDELGMLHTNFKLDPDGEYLAITSPEGDVLHEFSPRYPDQRADVSYGIGSNGEVGFLHTVTPTGPNGTLYPGVVDDTAFSIDRGFYTEPVQVEITTTTADAQIRYTLDGSNPTETHGDLYTGPITISGTSVLKAVAIKDSFLPSNVDAHTYIFADQVLRQDGSGLDSARWGHDGADWAMDPIVVNHEDPEIRPEPEDLLRIPTVSLSLDFDVMFGNGGIYIHGENIEKPVSFEFFDPSRPDNGVQANSTIQIVGGSSPNRWKSDKLSMRVRFTEDEGPSNLNYPVFGPGATTEFDTLVVDARLNNVWHYGGGSDPDGQRGMAQYMRDEFAADLQNAVGGFAPHGQHAHVYINGIYWGMHILHERPDENFMASYKGGFGEEYDVLKHTANTVVNGSNETFREMFSVVGRSGELTDEQWDTIQSMLDVDDFIDYMLVNFYGGNQDWDHHNWYASRHHEEGLWRFHSWDAEKVLQGIRDDVTSKNNPNAPTQMHRRLSTHPEYVLMFADHVQEHFYNGGAMTPEAAAKLYKDRSDQIDLVMRVESARWGDNQIDQGRRIRYVRPDWVANRDHLMNNYFPQRTDIVISQFERRDLFVAGEAPQYSIDGTAQHGGFAVPGSRLTMSAPDGDIYFTTDGSDPRLTGGEVAPSAQQYTAAVTLDASTVFKARLLKADGTWSALSQARFVTSIAATTDNLRISEVHYHPGDPSPEEIAAGFDNSDDFEFIEIVNISDTPVDLGNVTFQKVLVGSDIQGIDFAFGQSSITEIGPGERVVIVEDAEAFSLRYGNNIPVAGEWSGRLGNNSERIVLMAGETLLHDFTYTEEWHPTTDGDGPSLQVVNESAADLTLWGQKAGWTVSSRPGGTPGTADGDGGQLVGDVNGDGVFDSGDLVLVFQTGHYEDGIDGNSTFTDGDWNGDGDFDSADIVLAFQMGHYQSAAAQISDTLAGVAASELHDQSSVRSSGEVDHIEIVQMEAKRGRRSELLLAERDEVFEELSGEVIHDLPDGSVLDDELLLQLSQGI